jgi:hypothetical protein
MNLGGKTWDTDLIREDISGVMQKISPMAKLIKMLMDRYQITEEEAMDMVQREKGPEIESPGLGQMPEDELPSRDRRDWKIPDWFEPREPEEWPPKPLPYPDFPRDVERMPRELPKNWREIFPEYKRELFNPRGPFPEYKKEPFNPRGPFPEYKFLNKGGRIGAQEGGLMDLGGMEKDYREEGGFVPIGGQERADDVPARLSKNEFVFTADAVRSAGGGDIDKGAEVMENVMEHLEQGGQISEDSQGLEGARNMFATAQRLEGVM